MCRLLVGLLFLSGCASPIPKGPNLHTIYSNIKNLPKLHPLIFIPGLFGSSLVGENGEIIWGEKRSIFKKSLNEALTLPVSSKDNSLKKENMLHPYRLAGSLQWIRNVYEVRNEDNLIKSLQDFGGYRVGDINNPSKEDNFYYFSYDWRLDIVENAKILQQRIDAIKGAWGDPSLKIDIIGHSMGGLLARYYAKYGKNDFLDLYWLPPPNFEGAKNINKLVIVATPHMGSAVIIGFLHYGLPMWHLRPRIHPETMLTWPSIYQLLPSQWSRVFLNENLEEIEDFDIYNIKSWEKYNLSIFGQRMQTRIGKHYGELAGQRINQLKPFMTNMLHRAKQFHKAIEDGGDIKTYPIPVFGFGGDCLLTPEYVVINNNGALELDKNNLNTPGDGNVSRNSFLGLESRILTKSEDHRSHVYFKSTMLTCETHSTLTENSIFYDNILQTLLTNEYQ